MPYQPVLGQIMPFAGTIVPRGWALCNGAMLPIQNYQALFSLIGTYYGGNGAPTFWPPDLRGPAILGSTGQGGQYPVGVTSGSTSVMLNVTQMPQHNHGIQASTTAGTGRGALPTGHIFGVNNLGTPPKMIFSPQGSNETPTQQSTNIVNTGGNQPHNNMQPYLVISYLIALQGTYPSRN